MRSLGEVGGDVIGRIYEYFLNKFAKSIASDDGMFFTPKSLVKMIVNFLEPKSGILLNPACGFRVIIMTQENSQVNTRVLELLLKFKIKKMNSWYAV